MPFLPPNQQHQSIEGKQQFFSNSLINQKMFPGFSRLKKKSHIFRQLTESWNKISIFSSFSSGYIHTHPFNGPLSRTTWVGRYQKGKTNLDFTEARDSEWK